MQWYDQRVCSKCRCVPLPAGDWYCDKSQCDSIRGNISVSSCWDLELWHYLRMGLCCDVESLYLAEVIAPVGEAGLDA